MKNNKEMIRNLNGVNYLEDEKQYYIDGQFVFDIFNLYRAEDFVSDFLTNEDYIEYQKKIYLAKSGVENIFNVLGNSKSLAREFNILMDLFNRFDTDIVFPTSYDGLSKEEFINFIEELKSIINTQELKIVNLETQLETYNKICGLINKNTNETDDARRFTNIRPVDESEYTIKEEDLPLYNRLYEFLIKNHKKTYFNDS